MVYLAQLILLSLYYYIFILLFNWLYYQEYDKSYLLLMVDYYYNTSKININLMFWKYLSENKIIKVKGEANVNTIF